MWEKASNSYRGYLINILDYKISSFFLGMCVCLCLLLTKRTYGQILCKSCPVEFSSYFHYCQSLSFDQRPDYPFVKRLFRDLFNSQGILSNTMHGVSKVFFSHTNIFVIFQQVMSLIMSSTGQFWNTDKAKNKRYAWVHSLCFCPLWWWSWWYVLIAPIRLWLCACDYAVRF